MKKIDKDMVIIISMCLLFCVFLINGKENKIIKNHFNIMAKLDDKEIKDVNIIVHRENDELILPMNKYLIGVVGCEVEANYEMEALKTQAIVARTYALRSIDINRKLTNDTRTQCYKDDNELKKKWGNKYDEYYDRVEKAVNDTDNLAIYYDNKLIDALYHSVSNGYTEDAKNVWGNNIEYLVSVDSSWDKSDKYYKNTISKDINDYLNILGVTDSNYSIISKDISGRVLEIKVGDKTFSGVEFRKLLGLKSTDFEININNNKVDITTYGYGHGVGLSQYGANYLAKQGYKYEDIIKYYYKGVNIK